MTFVQINDKLRISKASIAKIELNRLSDGWFFCWYVVFTTTDGSKYKKNFQNEKYAAQKWMNSI
jgi:hypothetical protein